MRRAAARRGPTHVAACVVSCATSYPRPRTAASHGAAADKATEHLAVWMHPVVCPPVSLGNALVYHEG